MNVLYFGCGANRDKRMISAILGKPALELEGIPARLQDYELAVQRLDQTPKNIKERLSRSWDRDFESYVIRPKPGSQVSGTIWKLTAEERDRIRHWELIDFGWYEDCEGTAITDNGEEIHVIAERLGKDQAIDRVVDGLDYSPWLNPPEKFDAIAEKSRQEYGRTIKHK